MSRLLLLLAMVCVSSAALFAHRALQEATPLAISAWRLGFASLFFLGWQGLERSHPAKTPVLTATIRGRLILAGVCLALHFLTWFVSLQTLSIAQSTLLVCTTPLWTALGGLVLGRPSLSRVFWPALVLAATGIWLVTQTTAGPHTSASLHGDLWAIAGGVFIAIYLLAVEGLHTTLSARRQVTVTYTVAALALWAVLLIHGGATLHYSAGTWGALLGMALGPQILGHTLLNVSLRHFPSSAVAFATLLEPIFAALLAWLLLRQAVTAGQMVGSALVLLGLALVIAPRKSADPHKGLIEPV
jgi:drug/metabolite transporter (DMT)-like permease